MLFLLKRKDLIEGFHFGIENKGDRGMSLNDIKTRIAIVIAAILMGGISLLLLFNETEAGDGRSITGGWNWEVCGFGAD